MAARPPRSGSPEKRTYAIDKSADHPPGARGEEERIFETFLRERGLKFTRARRELLRKVFAMHDHFTADQLMDRLKADGVRASKATIYRTLGVLAECGLLTGHDFGEGALYYEHTHGHSHHDHLFCVHCKAIEEFFDGDLEAKQEEIVRRMGFRMLSHSLKIYGLCGDCTKLKGIPERYAAQVPTIAMRS